MTRKDLHNAISNNHFRIVKYLVESKHMNITNIEIILAVHNSRLTILKYLIEHTKPSLLVWPYAVTQAATEGKIEFLDYLFNHFSKHNSTQYLKSVFIDSLGTALENNQLEAAKFIYKLIY